MESSRFIVEAKPPKISWNTLKEGLNVLPFNINLVVDPAKPLNSMFKKNPIFVSLLAVCLLVFGALAFLAFSANGKNSMANLQLRKSEQQLKSLNSEISLTQVNVDASNANIDELSAELERISAGACRGAELSREEDGGWSCFDPAIYFRLPATS